MKITKDADLRMTESRKMLWDAFMVSYGSYTEQEAKKTDSWRDQTVYDLIRHMDHEMQEIKRSTGTTMTLHNAMDMCSLAGLLIARLMQEE
jgi:hypothetical protein